MKFDSVQIGSADVAAAARAYEALLGVAPVRVATGAARFQLLRGAVEIGAGGPGLRAIRFRVRDEVERGRWSKETFHGLHVEFVDGPEPAPAAPSDVAAIDHVVVNSPDLDRAVALWRDRLGLRLALDREFPQRGMRLAFFRSAGVTLEFAGALPPPADRSGSDTLYGLAYRVRDLDRCCARLAGAGIDVSERRAGQKSGTIVATVRSSAEGVPTLLIEDPGRG